MNLPSNEECTCTHIRIYTCVLDFRPFHAPAILLECQSTCRCRHVTTDNSTEFISHSNHKSSSNCHKHATVTAYMCINKTFIYLYFCLCMTQNHIMNLFIK